MKRETYAAARVRLLGELSRIGWTVKPELKIPKAYPPGSAYLLSFKPQAVYMDQHSMWLDIRGMTFAEFVDCCNATYRLRTIAAQCEALGHDWNGHPCGDSPLECRRCGLKTA